MLKIPFRDGFSSSSAGSSQAAGRASLGMSEERDCSWGRSVTPRYLEVQHKGWPAPAIPAQPVCQQKAPSLGAAEPPPPGGQPGRRAGTWQAAAAVALGFFPAPPKDLRCLQLTPEPWPHGLRDQQGLASRGTPSPELPACCSHGPAGERAGVSQALLCLGQLGG